MFGWAWRVPGIEVQRVGAAHSMDLSPTDLVLFLFTTSRFCKCWYHVPPGPSCLFHPIRLRPMEVHLLPLSSSHSASFYLPSIWLTNGTLAISSLLLPHFVCVQENSVWTLRAISSHLVLCSLEELMSLELEKSTDLLASTSSTKTWISFIVKFALHFPDSLLSMVKKWIKLTLITSTYNHLHGSAYFSFTLKYFNPPIFITYSRRIYSV